MVSCVVATKVEDDTFRRKSATLQRKLPGIPNLKSVPKQQHYRAQRANTARSKLFSKSAHARLRNPKGNCLSVTLAAQLIRFSNAARGKTKQREKKKRQARGFPQLLAAVALRQKPISTCSQTRCLGVMQRVYQLKYISEKVSRQFRRERPSTTDESSQRQNAGCTCVPPNPGPTRCGCAYFFHRPPKAHFHQHSEATNTTNTTHS